MFEARMKCHLSESYLSGLRQTILRGISVFKRDKRISLTLNHHTYITLQLPQKGSVFFFPSPEPLNALEGRVSSLCKWSSCLFSIWLWHRPITFLSWSTAASQAMRVESISYGPTDGSVIHSTVVGLSGDTAVKSTYPQSKRKMRLGLHADEERSSQETHKRISNLSPALLDHTVPLWGWGVVLQSTSVLSCDWNNYLCWMSRLKKKQHWHLLERCTQDMFRETSVRGKFLCYYFLDLVHH